MKSERRALSEKQTKQNFPSATGLLEGTVVDGRRGQYWVETPQGTLRCRLRGRLRKQLLYAQSSSLPGTTLRHKVRRANVRARDPLAVGDRVRVRRLEDGQGQIEEILERRAGAFVREDVNGVRTSGQVTTVAGIDQLVAVLAARDPAPHLGLLDRLLVLAEAQGLRSAICLNKVDLGPDPSLLARLDGYRRLGYPVVLTSAVTGAGLKELRRLLGGHTSALLGPSGAGKSSLLNALEPGLGQRVSEVNRVTGKGRHTTSGTRAVPLNSPGGGFVADTAGIRTLALGGAAPGQLDWCFREFRPYLGHCAFGDCSHRHEPDCAVRQAAGSGAIDPTRYRSYVRLYEEGAGARGRAWRDLVSSRSVVSEGEFRM